MVVEGYYFVGCSIGRRLLHRIGKEEYELLKKFNLDFNKFSNVVDCYKNFIKSKNMLEEYINKIETDIEEMEKIYSELKFLVLTNILLGRLFVDNCKAFSTQLKLVELKELIRIYEQYDEIRILKILRDFGQHFSIPVDNLVQQVDLLKERATVKIYISKSELERNKGSNKQNDKFISEISEKEIELIESFKKWSFILDKVFLDLKSIYYNQISSEIKRIVGKYFSPVILGNNIYRPNYISIESLDQSNISLPDNPDKRFNTYINIAFTRFSRIAMDELFSLEFDNVL